MKPEHFHLSSLPPSERNFPVAKFELVAKAFLELFELLEEYAPVWYSAQHHNRAVVAKRILQSFVPAGRKPNQQREIYFGSDR
jgi:hypothetical protein